MKIKKIFVSGCFDPLHSGHIAFFNSAAKYGDLYVSVASDKTIKGLKKRNSYFPENERLFCVESIKSVKKAFIGSSNGLFDFLPEFKKVKPDIFVVNKDGASKEKLKLCKNNNVKYIVLKRIPHHGLLPRTSTEIRIKIRKKSKNIN